MHPARKIVKYILWFLLALIVGLIGAGLISHRFDVVGYVNYLNERDVRDVSLGQPMSIIRLFVPAQKPPAVTIEDLLQDYEEDVTSTGIGLDEDFMDFFGDFSRQDNASSIVTGEDFGFVSEPQNQEGTGSLPTQETGSEQRVLTEEEQQALLIERLREREERLQQEAMMEQ